MVPLVFSASSLRWKVLSPAPISGTGPPPPVGDFSSLYPWKTNLPAPSTCFWVLSQQAGPSAPQNSKYLELLIDLAPLLPL